METRSIRRGYGYRPKKRLGQHFIRDKEIILQIIDRAGFKKNDQVVEVGPGLGALTIPLARAVHHITAVEKDSRLVDMLGKRLSREGVNNVTIVNNDILRLDLRGIQNFTGKKIKLILEEE